MSIPNESKSIEEKYPEYNKKEVYEFLEGLRATGRINMMQARPHLEGEFAMSRKEAEEYLLSWMEQ